MYQNINKAMISPQTSLGDVLKALDAVPEFHVIVVVDENRRLIGTITDGDIRRALLAGKSMNELAGNIAHKNALILPPNSTAAQQRHAMQQRVVRQVIIVDDQNHVLDIITMDSLSSSKPVSNKVFLMAGGLGTRLRPLTETIPKPMLHVGGKPILQTTIEKFVDEGFEDFYIAVNYLPEIIKSHFGNGERFNCNITYIQETKRMGTCGALSLIQEAVQEPIVVMNGDLLTHMRIRNIIDFHNNHSACATMAVREYHFQVPFGVVEIDDCNIKSISEKPEQSFHVNAGIYVVSPEVLRYIPSDTFYDMTTLFEDLKETNLRTVAFPLHEYWIDIGCKEQLEKANDEYLPTQILGQ
ncbi:nucleotidyltransferase family protein [Thalassospira xianhensis]|uniref:CBS domain-containing protein n=1 Tax=Thalassospira xianhensis MCCC 1A02616 TaxID=1177929 RepID=A0A367UGS3_9PROT|nr:nucleotidyltransferase family protein [Thalassospira xianhensis]RCK07369.1 hypothetical protein TH5_02985 [Thalassospira xianhensis MCCC 1A02616]